MPPIPPKNSKKELDAVKIANELKLIEIQKRKTQLEKQYKSIKKGEIQEASKLTAIRKEAVNLAELEKNVALEINKAHEKQNYLIKLKNNLLGKAGEFLKKELNVSTQLEFIWTRVKHSADLYAKVQGRLPELTGKQISAIERLSKKIMEQGVSIDTAWETLTSMPEIMKDATEAAKNLAWQQFKMAEAARNTALSYGKTFDEIRALQTAVQKVTAIRITDNKTRKDVERITDSILYLQERAIVPTKEEALDLASAMSRQFGIGTTKAVKEAANALEKLSKIPDYISDRMKKLEGVTGRFAATNRQDFLKSVIAINEAYGTQNTILKNVGATFALMATEARKYGAEAQTAVNVAKGISGALAENKEDSHIAFLAGERLADKLRDNEDLFKKVTAGMTKEMQTNVRTLIEEGGLGFVDLSKVLATTTEGMAERLEVIRDLYSGQGLAVTGRLLSTVPGLNLQTAEEQMTAARLLTGGKTPEEIIKAIEGLRRVTEREGETRREAEKRTTTLVNTIADPKRAAKAAYEGTKEMMFTKAAEAAPALANEENVRKIAMATMITAGGVKAISSITSRILSTMTKGGAGKAVTGGLKVESALGRTIASMKGGEKALKILSKIPGGAKLAAMIAKGGAGGAKLAAMMGKGPGMLLKGGLKMLGPAMFGYDMIAGGMGEAMQQSIQAALGNEKMDWDKLAENLGTGGMEALTMGGMLFKPGEWIAKKLGSKLAGVSEDEAVQMFQEATDISSWMSGMENIGSTVAGYFNDTPEEAKMRQNTNMRGMQKTTPPVRVTDVKPSGIQRNADGSATFKSNITIEQKLDGWDDSVMGSVAKAEVNKAR